jgi:hypothetical protein
MAIDLHALRRALESLSRDELIEILLQQSERIEALEARVAQLAAALEAREGDPPPSAPFRIDDAKRARRPKRPGRTKGHPGARRQPPPVTERIEVALPACPDCGGPVTGCRPVRQIIEELPEIRLRVVALTTWRGRCPSCGPVASRHPLQLSSAVGAAGVQVGPKALEVAARLRAEWHLPVRKVCAILEQLFGLRVTPGGLLHALGRVSERLRGEYEALEQQIRASAVVYSDETSWYVGAPRGSALWVFATPEATLYRVVAKRTRAQLQAIIGEAFGGVLVSDCLSLYDDASERQQKCYAHHLRAIRKAEAEHPGGGSPYLRQVKVLLRAAMAVKAEQARQPETWRRARREGLERWAERLLEGPRGQPEEERVRQRLSKQRDHLFVFLEQEAVEATNNLAERQLRPAVISRKVSCGNRTWRGARSWERLASLVATCAQTGRSFGDLVRNALSAPTAPEPAR